MIYLVLNLYMLTLQSGEAEEKPSVFCGGCNRDLLQELETSALTSLDL